MSFLQEEPDPGALLFLLLHHGGGVHAGRGRESDQNKVRGNLPESGVSPV